MRKSIVVLVSSALLAGCVAYPSVHHAADDHQVHDSKQGSGTAFGYLVASPILILAGLSEGIATAPYLETADLHEMDREMRRAGTDVSLDATYRHAYGRRLEDVPKSGATGRVFRRMEEATRHFQRVLTGYGIASPKRYVLTAIRAADRDGYTLYALVERRAGAIRVRDSTGRVRVVHPGERAYYRPWEYDAEGHPLDIVIDWAAVPRSAIRTQKGQAILLTLAANSVLINRRSGRYWEIEDRWLAGEHEAVVAERKSQLDRRMLASG